MYVSLGPFLSVFLIFSLSPSRSLETRVGPAHGSSRQGMDWKCWRLESKRLGEITENTKTLYLLRLLTAAIRRIGNI